MLQCSCKKYLKYIKKYTNLLSQDGSMMEPPDCLFISYSLFSDAISGLTIQREMDIP